MNRLLALASLGIALAAPLAQAQSFVQVRDWDVFVDLPTGFAYVKTPIGWKFVRQLDDGQLTRLPESTLTSLLPRELVEIRYAHPAMELSPRMMALRAAEQRLAEASSPARQP
jgi:hypothetical protein